jgi:hypothetical protein
MLILCLSIPHDTYSLHPDSTTSVLRSSLNIELINWKKNQLGHKLHRKTSPLMLSYTFPICAISGDANQPTCFLLVL